MAFANAQQRSPFPSNPEEFDDDERISYSKVAQTYVLEDETGSEWEWSSNANKWIPVMDEALLEQQQQIYKIKGVDEDAPALDLKKRKMADGQIGNAAKAAKKQKPDQGPPKNKAIYITSLPEDADMDEIEQTFSKFGVIAESLDNNEPRIKMYYDEDGKFKGEALVVYFRPESVDLAINMLDRIDFRMGQKLPTGPMRVVPADQSFKSQKDQPLAGDEAKKKGTTANRDRQKVIKKNEEMNRKLADWDDDDPQTIPNTSSRHDKVVVIKHMFTLQMLADEPEAIMDIKEDIREDGEKYGQITNVIVYDKEEDGVVTVRFSNATAARAYADAIDGRAYDRRILEASIADGSERYKKSTKHDTDDADEEARLKKYREELEAQQ